VTVAALALAFGVPAVLGWLVARLCLAGSDERSVLDEVILGWGLGMGLVSLVLFALGAAGARFTLGRVLVPAGVALVALAVASRRVRVRARAGALGEARRTFAAMPPTSKAATVALGAWLGAKGVVTVWEALLLPISAWDSWAQWSGGAKFFYLRGGFNLSPADPHFFGWDAGRMLLNYPLHVSLAQVWFALCLGRFDEVLVKAWAPVTYVAVVALLYRTLRRETTVPVALVFALALASSPLLTFHALEGYADLTLAFYELAAVACFWRVVRNGGAVGPGDRGALFLTGCFTALAIWTKQEGVLFAVALVGAGGAWLVAKRRLEAHWPALVLPPAGLLVVWFMFLGALGLPFLGRGEVEQTVWHWEVVPVIARELLLSANFNVVFAVFAVVTAWGFRTITRGELKYPYLVLVGVAALLLLVYVATENFRWVMNLTGLDRNVLTLLPIVYLLTGLTATRLRADYRAARGDAHSSLSSQTNSASPPPLLSVLL
jgi:hypothetical protein